MDYCGRFAPSPTGKLHFGSLVTAVGSWLCARHAGGRWLVRMEDIDPPREAPGAAAAILSALPAFGLVADGPVLWQSQRIDAYQRALEQLRAGGHAFPCWCSRSELAACEGLHRDAHCITSAIPTRAPAWRMRSPDRVIAFTDLLQGPQQQNLRDAAGDFVIRRTDGLYAYQLACVVDDAFQQVTEVVRGYDLLDSTARQIWLQRCLALPTPSYRHLPLALDSSGRKLSKSESALPVDPSDPMPALRRALHFLELPEFSQAKDCRDLLGQSLQHFEPELLPHCSGHSAC